MDIETQQIVTTLHCHHIDKSNHEIMTISIRDAIVNFRQLTPEQIHYIAHDSKEYITEILELYNEVIKNICGVLENLDD